MGTLSDLLNADELLSKEDKEKILYIPWYSRRSGNWHEVVEVGVVQTQDRAKCDSDIQEACSFGLHVGGYKYVDQFGSGPDRVILACLVDPAQVVALPAHDTSKIRVCEYYPYAVIKRRGVDEWVELPAGCFESTYNNKVSADLIKRLTELDEKVADDLLIMARDGIGIEYGNQCGYTGGYKQEGYVANKKTYSRKLNAPEDKSITRFVNRQSIVSKTLKQLGVEEA